MTLLVPPAIMMTRLFMALFKGTNAKWLNIIIISLCVSSSNAPVLSAVTSDARFRSRIIRHWLKLLYRVYIHFDGG